MQARDHFELSQELYPRAITELGDQQISAVSEVYYCSSIDLDSFIYDSPSMAGPMAHSNRYLHINNRA